MDRRPLLYIFRPEKHVWDRMIWGVRCMYYLYANKSFVWSLSFKMSENWASEQYANIGCWVSNYGVQNWIVFSKNEKVQRQTFNLLNPIMEILK